MRPLAFALILAPRSLTAAGIEVTLNAGQTLPFYEQTFHYRPIPLPFEVPGATVDQQGGFEVQLRGGLALGGSLALVPKEAFAVEARFDLGSASAELRGAHYAVTIDLPRPLPRYQTTIEMGSGTAQLEGLRSLSLNLQLRIGSDRARFLLSGGGSYLPSPGLSVRTHLGMGLTGFDGRQVRIATIEVEANDPANEAFWGGNLGASVQVGLARRLALLVDGRVFVFESRTFKWTLAPSNPSLPVATTLSEAFLRRLEPLQLRPGSFQMVGGLVLRF